MGYTLLLLDPHCNLVYQCILWCGEFKKVPFCPSTKNISKPKILQGQFLSFLILQKILENSTLYYKLL